MRTKPALELQPHKSATAASPADPKTNILALLLMSCDPDQRCCTPVCASFSKTKSSDVQMIPVWSTDPPEPTGPVLARHSCTAPGESRAPRFRGHMLLCEEKILDHIRSSSGIIRRRKIIISKSSHNLLNMYLPESDWDGSKLLTLQGNLN